MTARFTQAISLSIPADMRARVMPCATAWLCLYAFLTVGSIVSSLWAPASDVSPFCCQHRKVPRRIAIAVQIVPAAANHLFVISGSA